MNRLTKNRKLRFEHPPRKKHDEQEEDDALLFLQQTLSYFPWDPRWFNWLKNVDFKAANTATNPQNLGLIFRWCRSKSWNPNKASLGSLGLDPKPCPDYISGPIWSILFQATEVACPTSSPCSAHIRCKLRKGFTLVWQICFVLRELGQKLEIMHIKTW